MDQELADVRAVQVTGPGAAIVCALAVQLASGRRCSRVPLHQTRLCYSSFNSEARTRRSDGAGYRAQSRSQRGRFVQWLGHPCLCWRVLRLAALDEEDDV